MAEFPITNKVAYRAMTRRTFLKHLAWLSAGASTLGWMTKLEPSWIEIERRAMPIHGLAPVFDGLRLAQISDIHLGPWMTEERLHQVLQRVNALNADLIALTGDFVTRRQLEHLGILRSALSTLSSRLGSFAVLGNHDHWGGADIVRKALRRSGVEELCNSCHTLRRGGETLHICGLDDAWTKRADMSRVLQQLPQHGPAILLAHEPDFADDYAQTRRFDWQLSGHTHGGQIRIPLFGPLHLPPFGQKYHTAEYSLGAMKLYVNRGIGMVWPYVRFDCRPEITLFTLRAV
jgi:predicted MPP superfamily phosphohydrolase